MTEKKYSVTKRSGTELCVTVSKLVWLMQLQLNNEFLPCLVFHTFSLVPQLSYD